MMEKIVKSIKLRAFLAIVLFLIITTLAILLEEKWITTLYAIILAFFPQEIKTGVGVMMINWFSKRLRVTYSYKYRIMLDDYLYLLVLDEHGHNLYVPVGGVYKYDQDSIKISEEFDAAYDGLYPLTKDNAHDLRLKIGKKKLENFRVWVRRDVQREHSNELSREFREELLDTNILPAATFRRLKYTYIGTAYSESLNKKLHMHQVKISDVLNVHLTTEQIRALERIRNTTSPLYIFASENEIKNGYVNYAGTEYRISEDAKLILVENAQGLEQMDYFKKNFEYDVPIK